MKILTLFIANLLAMLAFSLPSFAQADYAAKNAWQFNNFPGSPPNSSTPPKFSWDIYRDTFIGIPPNPGLFPSAFDDEFYNQLYSEKIAYGNCYGMSLLSLMILKNGGHLGYCAPLPQYSGDITGQGGPTDQNLQRAINIMQGHQVNLPTLQYLLDLMARQANRDGEFAYHSFEQFKLKQDLTLVSITKSLIPSDGGHTMVAYNASDLGGGNKRIFVYDPNRPWADLASRRWYESGQNIIKIKVSDKSWSYDLGGSLGEWSGCPTSASGGNLIITPISITGPRSRTPASLGLSIISQIINTLFLTGQSAKVEQVSDVNGKRLFKPGSYEVDADPATGMLSVLPWIPSDLNQPDTRREDIVLFQLSSSGGALRVKVAGSDSGYTLRSIGASSQVVITARGGQGTDIITLYHSGSGEPRVGIENLRGTDEYDVQFVQAVRPRELLHVLSSNRLRIPDGAQVELGVMDRHRALTISSPSAALQYDLELKTVTREGEKSLSRSLVVHTEGTQQTVQPQNWLNLQNAEVYEQVRPVRQ